MKRSFLTAICLSVASAFAGTYDIDDFTANDAGSPDKYIKAEFGGVLKTAPADEVESLQDGRLIVRQKFEDPFGEAETSYQLYQGGTGDLSSVTILEVPAGTSYSSLIKAKFYMSKNDAAEEDVEKVYFDGKSVFVPGLKSAVVYIDGEAVELKGAAPAAASSDEDDEDGFQAAPAVASSQGGECDEYDTDCDNDDDDDYDVSGNLNKSNDDADERYNSARDAAYDAGENATDRFGIADEVRFWSAVGLSALAATSAVLGILQHMEANKAQDAYDELDELHTSILGKIATACEMAEPNQVGACEVALRENGDLGIDMGDGVNYNLQYIESRMNTNKKTHDSYATARNIWFGVAGASIVGAVVLFVW